MDTALAIMAYLSCGISCFMLGALACFLYTDLRRIPLEYDARLEFLETEWQQFLVLRDDNVVQFRRK